MPWSSIRCTGRLRRPEPASARTTRVTVAHLSCLGSGQENAVLAARELANQARTSTPGHYRTGSKWMKYLFPDMTEQGHTDLAWSVGGRAARQPAARSPCPPGAGTCVPRAPATNTYRNASGPAETVPGPPAKRSSAGHDVFPARAMRLDHPRPFSRVESGPCCPA